MTFPRAPARPEELDKLMRRMRLPYLRRAAPDVLATARAQRWDSGGTDDRVCADPHCGQQFPDPQSVTSPAKARLVR
ncbi:hypothetical protein BX266_7379 [Streptomyces sp. TLI_171]|nr:hypothetical protein BX266_7379 [Streptomyces sp. TLI_171]